MQNKTMVVLKHEFNKIVKSKTFLVLTILGPFLLAAIMLIPMYFSMQSAKGEKSKAVSIGYYIEDKGYLPLAQNLQKATENLSWTSVSNYGKTELYQKVMKNELNGYLAFTETGIQYFTNKPADFYLNSVLQNMISEYLIAERLSKKGLDYAEVKELTKSFSLPIFKLTEADESGIQSNEEDEFALALAVPMIFSLMIYMSILLYGQMIGRSVVTEKSSKIVDVLLSSVKPVQLMIGKIFGVGLAGLLQYGIWIVMAVITLLLSQNIFNFNLPQQLAISNFVYLGVFFMLGYILYGALWAAIGSASEDEQHLGQLSVPFIIFLVVPITLMTAVINDPNSTLSVLASFFPLTAPIIMLARITTGTVPFWHIAVSIFLLLLSIILFIRLSSKIFKTGILMTGKNFKFKDILKWV